MLDRPPAYAKLLPLLTPHGNLAEAMAGVWDQAATSLDGRLGLSTAQREAMRDECLQAIAAWAQSLSDGGARGSAEKVRQPLTQWLLRLRQELSLEELL